MTRDCVLGILVTKVRASIMVLEQIIGEDKF